MNEKKTIILFSVMVFLVNLGCNLTNIQAKLNISEIELITFQPTPLKTHDKDVYTRIDRDMRLWINYLIQQQT